MGAGLCLGAGIEILARFDQARDEAVAGYEHTLAQLAELGKAIDPEGAGPLPEKPRKEDGATERLGASVSVGDSLT